MFFKRFLVALAFWSIAGLPAYTLIRRNEISLRAAQHDPAVWRLRDRVNALAACLTLGPIITVIAVGAEWDAPADW